MIVIGLDVHKQSVTAVAIDQAGRPLGEQVVMVGSDELLGWAVSLSDQRLWAVEDCRHLSRRLQRDLLAAGERIVRVPPKLMANAKDGARSFGKSDPIDALSVALISTLPVVIGFQRATAAKLSVERSTGGAPATRNS